MEYVLVDGSRGEGGGQILRTAIAFSVIQGRPVRVERIRAGRKVPGLKRQHVSALQVVAKVFDGALTGVTEGSREVTFVPGEQRLQTLSIDMGTAASITLVLQVVVPAVALTHTRLRIDLVGGTDVPWSPTYDYFDRIVRECYRSMGIVFSVAAERRGYYPRGGGRVTASIEPCESVSSLQLTSPHTIPGVSLVSRCGRLPMHVAERQLSSASTSLEKSGIRVLEKCLTEEQADSPGSSILAFHVGPGVFLGSDCVGARGKPAEEVGREVAMKFMTAMGSGACLDSNLADMVLPLLSLAQGPSKVAVPAITPHLESGLQLANQFTGCSWSAEAQDGKVIVAIEPRQSD